MRNAERRTRRTGIETDKPGKDRNRKGTPTALTNPGATSVKITKLIMFALTTLVSVTLEALAYLTLNSTGTRVEFGTLGKGQTLTGYAIPEGGQALTAVASFKGGTFVAGTPGIAENPGFPTVLGWIVVLMAKAKQTVAYLTPPQGRIAYYVAFAADQIVEIMSWGFAQLTPIANVGLIAQVSSSNKLYFLPQKNLGAFRTGQVAKSDWREITVPGVDSVDVLPSAIRKTVEVFCQVTIAGKKGGAVLLDFSRIQDGVITQIGEPRTNVDAGARVLGSFGDELVIMAGANSRNFDHGVTRGPQASLLAAGFGIGSTENAKADQRPAA